MLDFYDPTSLSSATDADLKKRMEISEAFLAEPSALSPTGAGVGANRWLAVGDQGRDYLLLESLFGRSVKIRTYLSSFLIGFFFHEKEFPEGVSPLSSTIALINPNNSGNRPTEGSIISSGCLLRK